MIFQKRIIIIALLLFFQVTLVWGKGSKNDLALPFDPEFQPALGTYHYEVTWGKMKVGSAQVTLGNDGETYTISVHAETDKKLDWAYKIKYRGETTIDTESMSPIETRIDEKTPSERKKTTMTFEEDGTIKTTEKHKKKKKREEVKTREITPDRFTLDPFSSVCLVRRLDWKVGEAEVFVIYSGKYQYELLLICVAKTELTIEGATRSVWVIVPDLTEIPPKEEKQDAKKKKSNVKIYLSADERKDVLRIEGHPKIGRVRAQLSKFIPAK